MTTSTRIPAPAEVDAAADRLHRYVRRTPLLRASLHGAPVLFKLEHLQLGGSFKLRGAVNALLTGPRPERVVAASGGNHGIGVATGAALLGLPATVYVPESAPAGKTRRIEAAGAELVRFGSRFAEAAEAARTAADAPGCRYLHAYDDPDVIAGQGTVAAEIVAEAPDTDAIVVAAGGGGLAAGTVLGAGGRGTVVVEPHGCRAVHEALRAGAPVDTEVDSVAASALGATRAGDLPVRLLSRPGTESVLVSDAGLLAARDLLWEEFRLAVEPAAAAPVAAWLAGAVTAELPCLVLCGANTDWLPG